MVFFFVKFDFITVSLIVCIFFIDIDELLVTFYLLNLLFVVFVLLFLGRFLRYHYLVLHQVS